MTKRITHRKLKIAEKGATEAFLRDNIGYVGEACLLWPFARNAAGYGLAVIDGHQTIASRLMCILVHGEPPHESYHAAHSCGNGHLGCIHPKHLSWKSAVENCADKLKHGTSNRGEGNGKTHLTIEDIRNIRNAPPNLGALTQKYGVSKGCISKIRSGQRWGHIS